jgi:hypothetical protein
MTRDETKKLVERVHRLWSTGNVAAISDLYAPDFIGHFPKGSPLRELRGHAGVSMPGSETQSNASTELFSISLRLDYRGHHHRRR